MTENFDGLKINELFNLIFVLFCLFCLVCFVF